MDKDIRLAQTETVPYYGGTLTRLATPLATPEATYRAARDLAATTYPREVATDAVRRLHGLSHTTALLIGETVSPYVFQPDPPGWHDPLDSEE